MTDISNPHAPLDVPPAEATRAFARIGLLSFGGPAAQIAVMHRILVEEKGWLTEKQFLHALNFCMLLPGPEAMQLATYAGWLMHGVRGGLIAGLLFIAPGLVMMLALSAVFVVAGDVPVVAGLLYGLKAAVLAVVVQALIKVSGRALGSAAMIVIAIAAFVGIALLRLPFPLIIALAALTGAVLHMAAPHLLPAAKGSDEAHASSITVRGQDHGAVARTTVLWLAIWLVPLAALLVLLGRGDVFADAALFFSQTAIVTFGGAYAVLAYVGQQAVDLHGWLTPGEMLAGLGLAETTLGPLVLVLVFVGFVGGASLGGMEPLVGGLLGGLVAAFFTFVPCFLWIFAGAPYVEALRNVRWLAASLAAITAAVVGVIANLAVWFGLNVLFGAFENVRTGPFFVPDIDWAGFDRVAAAIGIAAAVALIRFKLGLFAVLGAAAVAGVLATMMV
ncbi:chromate transporter [Oceaniradius stylonematis]|uniref:Chromate transporter n=1 Tax=Oceaniradius stylonematis TaxID=2184161 RepID=A0A3A8AA64_9HYPH|nr:chromate transporter [Oceaniradius stylonematis]RKF05869.1 chromate transporter [Oceaniradius stylonematis]